MKEIIKVQGKPCKGKVLHFLTLSIPCHSYHFPVLFAMLFLLFFSYQHAKCPFSIYLLVYLLVGLGGLELLLDAALTASCVHSQAVSPRGL